MTVWRLKVTGPPAPKGSMKCIGGRGPGKPQLLEDAKTGDRKVWRERLTAAARGLASRLPEPLGQDGAAVAMGALFVLPRPRSAASRPLPTTRSGGDLDKLRRMLGDALDSAEVDVDASRIALVQAAKVYETPGRHAGVHAYITDEHDPSQRILQALLEAAPELRGMNR